MRHALLFAPLALVACNANPDPVATFYDGNRVTVQVDAAIAFQGDAAFQAAKARADAEAASTCGGGAELIDETMSATFQPEGEVIRRYRCI